MSVPLMGAGCTGAGAGAVFSPANISGLKLWLKADSLSLNDNDPVATWTDSSGQGNDATQGTAGNRPTYKTGIQNGKPAVRFAAGKVLSTAAPVTTGQAFTAFAVVKVTAAGSVIVNGDSIANHGWRVEVAGGTRYLTLFANASCDDGASSGNFEQWAWKRTSAPVASFRLNATDTALGSSTAGMFAPTGVTTAGDAAGSFSGDLPELLIYDSALSLTDIQSVESYLNTKYAIY